MQNYGLDVIIKMYFCAKKVNLIIINIIIHSYIARLNEDVTRCDDDFQCFPFTRR